MLLLQLAWCPINLVTSLRVLRLHSLCRFPVSWFEHFPKCGAVQHWLWSLLVDRILLAHVLQNFRPSTIPADRYSLNVAASKQMHIWVQKRLMHLISTWGKSDLGWLGSFIVCAHAVPNWSTQFRWSCLARWLSRRQLFFPIVSVQELPWCKEHFWIDR